MRKTKKNNLLGLNMQHITQPCKGAFQVRIVLKGKERSGYYHGSRGVVKKREKKQ